MPRQRACELVGCLAERQLRLFLHVHLLLVLYHGHGVLLSGPTVHELIHRANGERSPLRVLSASRSGRSSVTDESR